MNLTEFKRSLSNFCAEYEAYIKLMSDIKRLDKLIQANEKQLNDSLIKIPFTHLYFVDGLGIQTPTLLKQNKRLISNYNKKVNQGKERDKLANKYLDKIGQIGHPKKKGQINNKF